MADLKELEKGFFETLTVLKDVLLEMVVVGGWCPYLYAFHLWKKPIPDIPTTTDIDLGVLETGNKRFEKTVYPASMAPVTIHALRNVTDHVLSTSAKGKFANRANFVIIRALLPCPSGA